jgi:hypothetical protein
VKDALSDFDTVQVNFTVTPVARLTAARYTRRARGMLSSLRNCNMHAVPLRTHCTSAGGGKTACYRSLQAAQTVIIQQQPQPRRSTSAGQDSASQYGVQAHVLNPKSITLSELYGCQNPVTNEWSDGLGSRMIRAAVADDTPNMHWVVFDGPVDSGWVESMNTGESLASAEP